METSQLTVTIVAEDATEFLVTVQDANGVQQNPQWLSKFTMPGSITSEWQARRAQADELIEKYQSKQNMMEAFGTSFINVYQKPGMVWSIYDEPAELPLLMTLTTKHYGGESIRLATAIDHAGWQAYEAQLSSPQPQPPREHAPDQPLPGRAPDSPLPNRPSHGRVTRASIRSQQAQNPVLPPQNAPVEPHAPAHTDIPMHSPSSPASMSGEPRCNDLQLLHEGPVTVFKCTLTQHGDHDRYSCTSCSSDAVMTLTPKQQDVYDFGAIFPLCDKCGGEHIADDISQRICDCLSPETKCSTCTWWTLNHLAATKFTARMRTFECKCCLGCRVLLRGDEKIGKCSFCGGLEVDE